MIRRPPRSTLDRSSAASDVYKRQEQHGAVVAGHDRVLVLEHVLGGVTDDLGADRDLVVGVTVHEDEVGAVVVEVLHCLLYTSDAADERSSVDLGGRRIINKKKKH